MKLHHRVGLSLLLLSAVLASTASAQDHLTLQECVDLALKNNPAMQIAEANWEKSTWGLKEAKGYNGLRLDYNFLYGRSDQPPSWYNNTTAQYPLSFNPLTGAAIQYPSWSNTYSFYDHKVTLTLPLYSGHKLESMSDAAKRGQIFFDLERTTTKQQLALDTTTSYYTALQSIHLRDVAKEGVDDFSAHLSDVKQQFDVGNVPFSDVLQTEVRLANARNNLIKTQNAVTMSRYKLNKTIGLELVNDVPLDAPISFEPYTATLADDLAAAFKNRPELEQAEQRIAIAKDKVKIANSDSLPAVNAVGTEEINDTSPGTSKHNTSWTAGINISFNVFDNGVSKAKNKEAIKDLAVAIGQKRQLEDAITLEVSNAHLNVNESSERITNNEVAVHQSQRDYLMAKERYNVGIGTNLDVMDAELAMLQAKTNYVMAIYDYKNSRAQLSKAIGSLYKEKAAK
ncbi:TolC family protein [Azotosporobacter soli]|uniref:TolC family protein n=1 Tax=Azotosporobacter soli TaxID=3055040 RepID=UPI0031FE8715